ncbi:phospholipid-binding protein, PBP family [Mizugakiibacter sediminis]|uniref:Phosphatidylethanolamine-binding protein n=1 Tax=Mizugakiibacter sediminis TaxID=1475481 RepID=A0A0K8QKC7_9GAMM|nr:YbhB/YbcL family Raf kinase inhibitor-like protein [Mizugakiibacter sediminis]GAP65279.1 phospholipid-binding protein, PBP family [Mizugakiibacter sediminis]
MKLSSRSFADGQRIPAEFAFGKPGADSPCVFSDNRNPQLAWSGAPAGTRSFVLMCIDSDVPTRDDDVNQPGRTVPHDLPRTDFVHWLMIDIPPECGELAAGSCSDGVVARGKRDPAGPPGSRQGVNDYTGWFAGDAAMAGDYLGYDGPCPPWNDARLHHYHFRLYALDVPTLGLHGRFGLAEVRQAMQGHVLAEAELTGTYSLNPDVRG